VSDNGQAVELGAARPIRLTDVLSLDRVLPDMRARSKQDALEELAALVVGPSDERCEQVRKVLADRERLASTAIGDEVAIPHGKLDSASCLLLGVARSRHGLDFESVDGRPTRLFFVLLAPQHETGLHLKALARISRLCKEPEFRARMLEVGSAAEMLDVLAGEDAKYQSP
jgi:PTS system nitrogen regulatory IIA component